MDFKRDWKKYENTTVTVVALLAIWLAQHP
jgi:hypothetical protein